MSNRKEGLKKSLGLTDYPWSSDDDTDPEPTQATTEPTVLRRTESTHRDTSRPSASEEPGTSGSQTYTTASQVATALARKRQARMDRDLFWSVLNSPRGSTTSRTSAPRVEVPTTPLTRSYSSTDGHVRECPIRSSPSANVQRILAISRLNRSYRQSRSASNLYNATQAAQVIRTAGNGRANREAHQHTDPMVTLAEVSAIVMRRRDNVFLREGRVHTPSGPTLNEAVLGEAAGPSGSRPRPLSAPEPVNVDNSDGEDVGMPPAMISPPTTPSEERDTSREEEAVSGAHNASAVTLEEEIVEIDAGPETGADAVDGPPPMTCEEVARTIHTEEPTAQASSNEDAPHGVKRKRDEYEDGEPQSVKEFNQSLLYLLECPVCLEWMEPPIAQCRRGHLVCARCRTRLAACPVCRTGFSSVRNRAMEGVAELLHYPCRHGCGREVRLRRRGPHEASCLSRRYRCPAPTCHDKAPYPHGALADHFQSRHASMLKFGRKHQFSMKVSSEQHDNWVIMALHELFHLRVDVDFRAWGVVVYVAYIGPKCNASNFTYEVTVHGQHNARKLIYTRSTHCDLECSSLNVSRQDCFHLTLDQALNFMNRHCEPDRYLNFAVEIGKCEEPGRLDSDS